MVVDARTGGRFSAGAPKVLIASAGNFEVDPTGQRFLILEIGATRTSYKAVVNGLGELSQRVAK